MRKKLTLMFVALIAVAAFAAKTVINALEGGKQEVIYALEVGDTFTSGQTVDVKNPNDGDVVATITYGEAGGAEFAAAKADGSAGEPWVASTAGNGTNGNKAGGTFYTIVPKYDGAIDIAAALNAGKNFYIKEDGNALEKYNAITVDSKYNGTFQFAVSAGKSYKVYCDGSRLGFFGFKYVYTLEPKSLYIAGLSDIWDISNMTEIPYNKDTKTYVYEANIENPNVYFAISDVASSTDWGDFNGSHRYAIVKGQNYTPAIGEQVQLIKTEGEGAIGVPGKGKYKFTITEDMKMTITEMAPDKLYIIGDVNGWDNTALKEMTFNATTQTFEYTIETEGPSNFSISTVPSFTNWDEDFKGIYRYAIGEGNNTPQFGEEIQLTKCVEGNIYLDKAGKYLISVNKDMKITVKQYEDIVIDNPSGDLAAAIADAEKGKVAKNITINLAAGAQYTLSESITISSDLTINGNGAIIDASTLETPMVSGNATAPTTWEEANVNISDLTIKGLNKALFYSAAKNTLYKNFIIDNCAIEVAADATTFDFTKGSVAENFTMTNSTVYAPTATTKQLYSSQAGQKATEAGNDIVQTLTFKNNTMYNLAKSKNFFSHRQSNQKWLAYTVQDNIFVNCGKSGQVIKGMNGGQGGTNPTWTISGNIFNYDGADTSAAEETGDADEPVKNSVAGVVEFTDAAHGDFNGMFVPANEEDILPSPLPGDPRWKLGVNAVAIDIKAEEIAEGSDIAEIIATKAGGHPISSINITLAEDKNYKLSAPIAASGDIVIDGKKATIDASEVAGALITIQAPAAAAPALNRAPAETREGYTYIDNIIIKDATVNGLKGNIVYDNENQTLVEKMTIDNVIFGLATDNNVLKNDALISIAKGNGCIKDFTIQNSTVYNTSSTGAGFFLRTGNNGTIDRAGYDKNTEKQSWTYKNNTFYNAIKSNGKWGNGKNGQNFFKYVVENNIWYNSSKDVAARLMNGRAGAGAELTFKNNTYFYESVDATQYQTNADKSGTILPTDPEFADAANGNFTIGTGTAQALFKTGDPRWNSTVAYDATKKPLLAKEITLAPATGADLSALVNAELGAWEKEGQTGTYFAGIDNLTINLNQAGTYTVSEPIVIGKNFAMTGVGAGGDKGDWDATIIDASALKGKVGLFKITEKPSVAKNDNDVYEFDNIAITGVKIIGLETYLINGQNGVKTLYKNITLDNSVVAIDGSKKMAVFFFQGKSGQRSAGVEQLTVSNSTLYAFPALEQAGGLFDNQSGSGAIQDLKGTKQVLTLQNTTLYNISKGKNTCSQGRNNQNGAAFEIINSIIVNCGKDKQFLKGLGGGGWRSNVVYTVDNSSFTYGASESSKGTDAAADEVVGAPAKATFTNIVYGEPFFRKDITQGIFTLGICPQIGKKVGDPRWYNIPMITNLQNALARAAELLDGAQEDWASAPAINEAVENLAAAYNDNKEYLESNYQGAIDEATARVEAAIAEFNKSMGDVTAIESVNAAKTDNAAWYTINGQRVDRPTQKGLYIHNGRKVVIK